MEKSGGRGEIVGVRESMRGWAGKMLEKVKKDRGEGERRKVKKEREGKID